MSFGVTGIPVVFRGRVISTEAEEEIETGSVAVTSAVADASGGALPLLLEDVFPLVCRDEASAGAGDVEGRGELSMFGGSYGISC